MDNGRNAREAAARRAPQGTGVTTMSDAWAWRPLGEVTTSGSTWNPRTDPRPLIRYVDVSAVSRTELRIISDVEYSAATVPSRARKIVKTGDTVFATVRPTLRRIAQIPPSLDGEIVSTAFSVLRPNPTTIHPDFLYFAMQLDEVTDGIAAMQTGASYPAVRDTDVLNQAIPLPPLSDQQEIATALNLVRSAVLGQKRCEDAAMNLKYTAMRTLFTRGLRGEAQKQTDIGPVPESWEVRKMEEVARVFSSSRLTYSELLGRPDNGMDEDDVTVLGIKVKDMAQSDPEAPMSDAELSRAVKKKEAEQRCIAPGAIVFPKNGAAVATNKKRTVSAWCVLDPNVMALHAEDSLEQSYLYQWIQTFDLSLIQNAGPVPNFGKGAMNKTLLPVPPMGEQREIVAVLGAVDRKADLHRRKRAVLAELFRALLHRLMSGEIRVGELGLVVFEAREAIH